MRRFRDRVKGYLASLLRLLPSPRSGSGFFGYVLFVLSPVLTVLALLGHADLIVDNIDLIESALRTWWVYPLLMLLGFLLLLYAGSKQQSRQRTQAAPQPETATPQPAPPNTDSRQAQEAEIEQLEADKAALEKELREHRRRVRGLEKDNGKLRIGIEHLEEEKRQAEALHKQEKALRNREGLLHELTKLIAEGEARLHGDDASIGGGDWGIRLYELLDAVGHVDLWRGYIRGARQERQKTHPELMPDDPGYHRLEIRGILSWLERLVESMSSDASTFRLPPSFDIEEYRERTSVR